MNRQVFTTNVLSLIFSYLKCEDISNFALVDKQCYHQARVLGSRYLRWKIEDTEHLNKFMFDTWFMPSIEAISIPDLSFWISLSFTKANITDLKIVPNQTGVILTRLPKFDMIEVLKIRTSDRVDIILKDLPINLKRLSISASRCEVISPEVLPEKLEVLHLMVLGHSVLSLPQGLKKLCLSHSRCYVACPKLPDTIECLKLTRDEGHVRLTLDPNRLYPNLREIVISSEISYESQPVVKMHTRSMPNIKNISVSSLWLINDGNLKIIDHQPATKGASEIFFQ